MTAAARLAALLALLCACVVPPARAQSRVVIEEVRVHGNYATPDAEVLRLAAIELGTPADASVFEAITRRLEDSGQFSRVQLRRRSRTLDDDSRVALIIVVTEHPSAQPVDRGLPKVPGPLGRLRQQTMFLPILGVEDGYGLTYGVRTALVGGRSSATRIAVPASWGGTRQLAIEAERSFLPGPPPVDGDAMTPVSTGRVTVASRLSAPRQVLPSADVTEYAVGIRAAPLRPAKVSVKKSRASCAKPWGEHLSPPAPAVSPTATSRVPSGRALGSAWPPL